MDDLLNNIPDFANNFDETDDESEWPELNSGENSMTAMENDEAIDEHLETDVDDQDQVPLPDVKCNSCSKLFSVSEITDHQIICSSKKMSDKNITICKYCQIEFKPGRFNSISSKRHLQQCKKYHSFTTGDGDNILVCKFCQTAKKSIGHLFNHLEKAHAKEISNLKNLSSNIKTMGTEKPKRRKKSTIFPSIKSCELCNFSNEEGGSYSSKYQLMEKHYRKQHFADKINSQVIPKMPKTRPFKCPASNCEYNGNDKNKSISKGKRVLLHYLRKHGILKKYINDAIQGIVMYSVITDYFGFQNLTEK